jgi:chromosome partitioning protein
MKKPGKVLSFLNQKGGVGKTTLSFNCAHALAQKGHKVLCLDMDPQANLSLLFGHTPKHHIHHLLVNSIRELSALHTPVLVQELIEHSEGVDLLAAGPELSGFELTVAGITAPRQLILRKFLETNKLLSLYDYIVIDGPPTLGLLVVNIMCASDGLLVPFRPDEFSRVGLGHFYEVLDHIGDMGVGRAPEVIAHIPNLVDLRRSQEAKDLARITGELEEEFGKETVVGPFLNRAPLVKTQAQKKSVYSFKSKEFLPLQEQFNKIAERIEDWNQHGH